jgi:hypothetical protein
MSSNPATKRHVRATTIFVNTQFSALHYWPNAKPPVEFLKNPHRHMFKVNLVVGVQHNDRDVEFLQLKSELDNFLKYSYADKTSDASCETMAHTIINKFQSAGYDVRCCSVSEDGENGATVIVRDVGGSEQQESVVERTKIDMNAPGAAQDLMKVLTGLTDEPPTVVESAEGLPEAPAPKKCKPCFVGFEAEGPYRGAPTLFVPGSTPPNIFHAARMNAVRWKDDLCKTRITSDHEPLRYYFGAGDDRTYCAQKYAEMFLSKSITEKDRRAFLGLCTFEIDNFDELDKKGLSQILIALAKHGATIVTLNPLDHQYKYVAWTKSFKTYPDAALITWTHSSGRQITTSKNDGLFLLDRDVSQLPY